MVPVKSSNQENGLLWLVKMVSGAFIVIILGIHLVVNHLVAPGGLLTFADVVTYLRNPAVLVMEALFLVTAVAHSLSGLRSILLDLNPPARLQGALNTLFLGAGVLAAVYGIWLLLVVSGILHA